MSAAHTPRFVAFSTIDDEPWEAGAQLGDLLDRLRECGALGIGLKRFIEILDCAGEADDILNRGTTLAQARERFPTVFRGDGVPGLKPITARDADR